MWDISPSQVGPCSPRSGQLPAGTIRVSSLPNLPERSSPHLLAVDLSDSRLSTLRACVPTSPRQGCLKLRDGTDPFSGSFSPGLPWLTTQAASGTSTRTPGNPRFPLACCASPGTEPTYYTKRDRCQCGPVGHSWLLDAP